MPSLVPSKRGGESEQIDSGNGHGGEEPKKLTINHTNYNKQNAKHAQERKSTVVGGLKVKNIFGESKFRREDVAQQNLRRCVLRESRVFPAKVTLETFRTLLYSNLVHIEVLFYLVPLSID